MKRQNFIPFHEKDKPRKLSPIQQKIFSSSVNLLILILFHFIVYIYREANLLFTLINRKIMLAFTIY